MGSKSSEFNTNRLYSRLLHSSGRTKCFILIGAVVVVILIAIIYFRPRAKSIVNTEATTTSTTWSPPSTPCPSLSCPPCKSASCPPCPPSSSLPSTPCPSVPHPSAAPCPSFCNTFKFTCQKTDDDETGTNPAFDSLHGVKLSGITGKTFSGESTRTFPESKLKFSSYRVERTHNTGMTVDGPQCDRWAVMTTIFSPDEGVYRQTRLENWCMVIVGDKKSPEHFDVDWTAGEGNNNAVVYLSPDDQKAMRNSFVDALLWNHFGRKNIGYLYAITHGAKAIWDFDDDNLLNFYLTGASPDPSLSLDSYVPSSDDQLLEVQELDGHTATTYNPYPYLGAPTLPSWPRGLPLSHIKQPETYNRCAEPARIRHGSVAVLQSLADHQPDVDAIFRFVMPIPFNFQRSDATRPLMIPARVLTPYNAQATLHLKAGFWGLLLPVSVNGRVSDIWRSYFFQRLFWDVGLRVGFMARPLVTQDRNIHSNLADFNAEDDLYQKSEQLIDFLQQWEGKSATLTGRIEELWVALYEHEYIDILDVTIVQLWLQALIDAGYRFPDLQAVRKKPIAVRSSQSEEEAAECRVDKKLTFWTSDLHDGSRLDVPSLLQSMGHKVVIAGIKKGTSPYPYVFDRDGIEIYDNLSPVLRRYTTHSYRLNEKELKENFEFYKNDEKIASVDAFICSFPASMCELWLPFNKTIIYLPTHRYNLGRCTKEQWDRLNEHVTLLASSSAPHPRHIIAAASVYDQEYMRHYLGIEPLPLYSFTGFYTNNIPYKPSRDEILLFSRTEIPGAAEQSHPNFQLVGIRSLYQHYKLSDLVNHRAIVYVPYSVMSYKLSELYSLSVPLFMPSIKSMQSTRYVSKDRSSLTSMYCNNMALDALMHPSPASIHPYSPNLNAPDDTEAEMYWLQFSDFFRFPHITYFDDAADLQRKLERADFPQIHELMEQENARRKSHLVDVWCRATKVIQTGREVPKDYDKAIQELYGVNRLQAI